jgi:hypothetical protein
VSAAPTTSEAHRQIVSDRLLDETVSLPLGDRAALEFL